MTDTSAPSLLDAAQGSAQRGWPVFPCHTIRESQCTCGKPDCRDLGKHPWTEHGFYDATTDPAQISAWWTYRPHANVGVRTGQVSGLVVLDVDPRHGGDETLRALETQHGPLPDTAECQTGGGGRHLYFAHPGGVIGNSHGKLGPGLDVKGDGGYVVAPPSRHKSGRSYEWEVEHHPDDIPLALPPAWLSAKLSESTHRHDEHGHGKWDTEPILDGKRNNELLRYAGAIRRPGLSVDAIEAALRVVNQERCRPPLEDNEVRKIAQSVTRYALATVLRSDERAPFPVELLPQPLRAFVEEGVAMFPCPPDFLAIPSLTIIGGAIGRTRILEIKPGWCETARLWTGMVAVPGDLKTPTLSACDEWVRQRQGQDYHLWKQELAEYENQLAKWQKRPKGDHSPKPIPPVLRQTFVSDTTIEALGKALQENPHGLALIADELAGFFLGIGQYKKNGGSDRKHFLSIWSGKSLKVDRLTRGTMFVPTPFLAVTGGIQPGVLKDLDPEVGMRDGMLHRLLLVEPESVPAGYSERTISPHTRAAMGNLYDRLYALRPEREDLDSGLYEPKALTMSPEAKVRWVAWYSEHAQEVMQPSFPETLRGPWAKLRGYSASLALILALAENPEALSVSERAVVGALTLIEDYFKPHLRRLYPRMLAKGASEFDRCRSAILANLRQHARTYKELRQAISGRYRGDVVREALADLVDAGEIGRRPKQGARGDVQEYFVLGAGENL